MTEELTRQFLYYPDRLPVEIPPPLWAGNPKEVWINTSDSTKIHGLWWPAPENRPVVLFLHGNAQEVYSWSLVREDLAALNLRMLLIDYRGYGKSEGEPGEEGLYLDGHGALDWLSSQGASDSEILVFGKSLGGAVACEIAQDRNLLGLILESTFSSLESVAGHLFPPAIAQVAAGNAYCSIDKIASIHCPLLVIHGDVDTLIPVEEGKALYAAANEPKELYIVRGADHNDVGMVAGSSYIKHISDWLKNSGVRS